MECMKTISGIGIQKMKLSNLFEQARIVAKNSHDAETNVGALLVDSNSGAVISSGYNGFVRGADDDKLPNTRPNKYAYIIHAEQNLLLNCARHGIRTEGCFMVVTLSPCAQCMRMAWQSGINTIYFDDEYRDFQDQLKMKDLKVFVDKYEGYNRIRLGEKNEG